MNRCQHKDCFTCPYPDCIAGYKHLRGDITPKEYDGKKNEYMPKQGYKQPFCCKGLKES